MITITITVDTDQQAEDILNALQEAEEYGQITFPFNTSIDGEPVE